MQETLLHTPYVVPRGQREVHGRFRAAPDFRQVPGDLGNGMTAQGLITIPEGCDWVTVEAEIRGCSELLAAPWQDWTRSQVRGIHTWKTRHITVRNTVIEDIPRNAILFSGVEGFDLSHSHARNCENLLQADYFSGVYPPGVEPLRNRGIHVHGFCTFQDGRSAVVGVGPNFSLLHPSTGFGTNAINLVAEDSEVTDFSTIGETWFAVKCVDGRRNRIARVHGAGIMAQGSCYWDPAKGPNAGGIYWPFGQNSKCEDLVIEDCILHPRLSLQRHHDNPAIGWNTLQLSYPSTRTTIRNNHLWWKQGSYPTQYSCIQLAEGYEAAITGNTFHKIASLTDHHAVWNAPANDVPGDGRYGDSAHEQWPSRILNSDWRTVNLFVPE